MARLLTTAFTAVATGAMAVGLNLPAAPALATHTSVPASWGTATTDTASVSDFNTGTVLFPAPLPSVSGLRINTGGYGHDHGGGVLLTVSLLPSATPVWTQYVSGSGSVSMAINVTFPPTAGVTGVQISSAPGQNQTYHSFSSNDTVEALLTDLGASPQCSDGIDNDLNGQADYPNDSGCSSPSDPIEAGGSGSCNTVSGVPACIQVTPSTIFQTVAVPSVGLASGPSHSVWGTVDVYRFALPTGGAATVACVVARVNGTTADPCKTAGGTFVTRIATLLDQTVVQPTAGIQGTLLTVKVCHATITTTVASIGIENFPAYTVC